MTDLSIDASVSVGGLNADDGAASGRALLDLGTVGGAVVEDGLVVVDIGDEDDDDGRRRVRRRRRSRRRRRWPSRSVRTRPLTKQ